uniref:DUF1618 domain-containing protein n=1 Tax=Setaria viridis TaxID=4556 RepID=A0A4U6SRY3_SETVI|nr:hypothetical protein SEVIR_9G051900v2 [Setaria viridis]
MAEQQGIIVIALSFRRECRDDDLFYFLVYDNIDASLSMINYLPDLYQATGASLQPVPNRTVGGACELLLMARELTNELPPVLCVFPPAAWAANSACPWQIKGRRFPRGEIREPFMATTAFSFQGKGFWADLAQGLVYCDLHRTTSDCNSSVDFGFIGSPGGCKLDVAETLRLRDEPTNLTRIMGCSGDSSIWFICIDCATEYGDDSVTMWTLQPPHGRWKEEWKFSTRELWGFDGFKEAGLPEAPPEFPVLTADGHLCVVLTDQRGSFEDDVLVGHICGIDVPNEASSKGQYHAMVGENDLVSLEHEISDVSERLMALEADRSFLEHSVNSLRNGKAGEELIRDITSRLRELRKIS